ncbi:Nitroreductase family protein [Mesorhizobium albiziae]|uniref:Nitroreductase family protein n=1 Tax=Neomesorhizobium albiziae TaxID=335020 RepID=A0A1I4C6G3_9HYPH|nr:Nitroreductase family protein [Mesorhizobium albiziae]
MMRAERANVTRLTSLAALTASIAHEAVRSATLGASMLMMAASAMGFSTGPMVDSNAHSLVAEFGLASDELPVMLVALGRCLPRNWPQKPRRPIEPVLELV